MTDEDAHIAVDNRLDFEKVRWRMARDIDHLSATACFSEHDLVLLKASTSASRAYRTQQIAQDHGVSMWEPFIVVPQAL